MTNKNAAEKANENRIRFFFYLNVIYIPLFDSCTFPLKYDGATHASFGLVGQVSLFFDCR